MPKSGTYKTSVVADVMKVKPARTRSYVNAGMGLGKTVTPRKAPGAGRFGGLPGGPSGGTMGSRRKSR